MISHYYIKMIPLTILGIINIHIALSQNVGIGTNTPTRAKLEVIGVQGFGNTSGLFGSNTAGISLQSNWPTIGYNQYRDDAAVGSQGKYMSNGFAAIQYMDPSTGTIAFDMFPSGIANTSTPAGVRAITIVNNGNTSIRGNYTNASLVVARGDGYEGTAVFAGPDVWSHFNYSTNEDTYIRPGKHGGTVYINKIPTGSVLVGTTSSHIGINSPNPFYTIEVYQPAGQRAFTLVDIYNNRWSMTAQNLNTLNNGRGIALDFSYNNVGRSRFQYWDGNYVVLSDARLKKDIAPMEPVLEKIKKLKPVKYEMIRNNPQHEKSIGFIAQEVKPLFPLMIHEVKENDKANAPLKDGLTMDHTGFGVLAIKALQEQYSQIQQLQKENDELMERLSLLEKKLIAY